MLDTYIYHYYIFIEALLTLLRKESGDINSDMRPTIVEIDWNLKYSFKNIYL